MKLHLIVWLLLMTGTAVAHATEWGERTVVDVLLGFDQDSVVILQSVDDTSGVLQPNFLSETTLVIKKIKDGQLILDKQIPVKDDRQIIAYINKEGFRFAVPKMMESKFLHLDQEDRRSLYYLGAYYNLTNIIPRELWGFTIDKLEQSFDFGEHLLVVIDFVSQSRVELLRKVILLK